METESVESARRIRVPVAESVGLSVLAWRSDGSVEAAAPLVLFHGIASNARTWDPVARILAGAGHDVFAVDFEAMENRTLQTAATTSRPSPPT